MTTLPATTPNASELSTYVQQLADDATALAQASAAANTQRAYASGVRDFDGFCQRLNADTMPATPQTVALYVAHLVEHRGLAISTVEQRLAAIRWLHERHGHESPTKHSMVADVLKGARRKKGTAPRRKGALSARQVASMVATLDTSTIRGKRDAALLLVGFAGGFRRSELVALDVADVESIDGGIRITIRRSKTDTDGEGRVFEIAANPSKTKPCPVRALATWLDAAGIEDGPIFRGLRKGGTVTAKRLGARSAATVVKDAAKRIGLDAADFGGHSLRRGFVTTARKAGKTDAQIKRTTGHKTTRMLDVYTALDGEAADSASAGLF